jgi:hypothetical protein
MNDMDGRFAVQAASWDGEAMAVAQTRAIGRALRSKLWRVGVASALVVSVSIAVYPILPRTYRSSATQRVTFRPSRSFTRCRSSWSSRLTQSEGI